MIFDTFRDHGVRGLFLGSVHSPPSCQAYRPVCCGSPPETDLPLRLAADASQQPAPNRVARRQKPVASVRDRPSDQSCKPITSKLVRSSSDIGTLRRMPVGRRLRNQRCSRDSARRCKVTVTKPASCGTSAHRARTRTCRARPCRRSRPAPRRRSSRRAGHRRDRGHPHTCPGPSRRVRHGRAQSFG